MAALGRGHAPRARRVGPNPRNVETDLPFPLSSEVVLEVAALATVLGEVVAMAVAITVAAVALDAVVAAVVLDAVVVAKIFLAFCVLWIWARQIASQCTARGTLKMCSFSVIVARLNTASGEARATNGCACRPISFRSISSVICLECHWNPPSASLATSAG